jgi:hypothetical protein
VDLDNWKTEDVVSAEQTGNSYINSIFEAKMPSDEDRLKYVFGLLFNACRYADSELPVRSLFTANKPS